MYINSSNLRKNNSRNVQKELIKKKKFDNVSVFKLFQDVNTRWNSTCHMLIRALHSKKTLFKYHDKHEAEYLRLTKTKWSQVKYLIELIKLFCAFIKTINQFKYSTIHQIFDIYDKLFDHLDRARSKLSRKKVSWKKIMIQELNAANAKLRQYYAKTQKTLNCLYEKTTLLSSNRKNAIFQESNWKVSSDKTFWSETYWSALKEQFMNEYYEKSSSSHRKQFSRIDDLNLLLNNDASSRKDDNDLHFYRKRDETMSIQL